VERCLFADQKKVFQSFEWKDVCLLIKKKFFNRFLDLGFLTKWNKKKLNAIRCLSQKILKIIEYI